MRGSNTITYIIAAVIILHFIAGFVYLIVKMSPKKGESQTQSTQSQEEE